MPNNPAYKPLASPSHFPMIFFHLHILLLCKVEAALALIPTPAIKQPSKSLCGSFLMISLSWQVPGIRT